MRYRFLSCAPSFRQDFTPKADEATRRISVCFTGHRIIRKEDADLLPDRLYRILEHLYAQGIRRFLCGGAMGFDLLAGQQVLRLKDRYPDVCLLMVIPCADQTAHWNNAKAEENYQTLKENAGEVLILSPSYYNGCMQVRNRYMVNHSGSVLCYLSHMRGGTMSTVAYAVREKIPVLNVAMEDACDAFIRSSPEE